MLLTLLTTAVLAREVVHDARPKPPPEAWYLFQGRAKCNLNVIVGADGVPEGAQAGHCPAALEQAGIDAVMRWRWAPSEARTSEKATVTFSPGGNLPRRWDGERCLHAFRVNGDGDAIEQDPTDSPRCEVTTAGAVVPEDFPLEIRTTAWCAVDVVAGPQGVQQLDVAWCPAELADEAAATARAFGYRSKDVTPYRVLLAYEPPGPES
jgi:hypothetical protein